MLVSPGDFVKGTQLEDLIYFGIKSRPESYFLITIHIKNFLSQKKEIIKMRIAGLVLNFLLGSAVAAAIPSEDSTCPHHWQHCGVCDWITSSSMVC